jgi:hypothetical protein
MQDMTGESRFFVYGRYYTPPAVYVRVDADGQSFIVDPGGKVMPAVAPVDRFLERVAAGWMAETTKSAIQGQIEDWNRNNAQKLKLP